ncbi:hypothetical protein [Pantoea sp. Mhis]|nr:hypothetical protein [Pantoea sp. Mhis]
MFKKRGIVLLILVVTIKRFIGKPNDFTNNSAVKLSKFSLGTDIANC